MATKRTTLLVSKFRGELVFVHGKLRLDRFSVYSLPPSRKNRKCKLVRDNKVLDTAVIDEYGTHGVGDYFVGFKSVLSKERVIEPRWWPDKPMVRTLFSNWFEEGDKILLPYDHRSFRAFFLEVLWSIRGNAPKYARFRKEAEAEEQRRDALYEQGFKKKYGFTLQDVLDGKKKMPRSEEMRTRRAMRSGYDPAYVSFWRAVKKERLPAIIRIRED